MSKIIKMTPEYLEASVRDFESALRDARLADGKLQFTKSFSVPDREAVVYFEPIAWTKMVMLVKEFSQEVAWHGVARRGDEPGEYIISDIVVYPQTVTGTNVDMDPEKYAIWLMENDEDERFASLRMQGHSHVNMAVTPSGTDLQHQEEILSQLNDDDFYIFMIWNKSFLNNTKIYDLRENVLFEPADVTIKLVGGGIDLDSFLAESKSLVVSRATGYQGNGGYNQYGQYGQYGNPGYGAYSQNSRPSSPGPYNPLPAKNGKTEEKKNESTKPGEKPKSRIGAGWAGISSMS